MLTRDEKLEVFRANCELDRFTFYNKGYLGSPDKKSVLNKKIQLFKLYNLNIVGFYKLNKYFYFRKNKKNKK